jgi:hypothetical protein
MPTNNNKGKRLEKTLFKHKAHPCYPICQQQNACSSCRDGCGLKIQFSLILVNFDKKVIGICFGNHIFSFQLWGCNFFLLLLLLLLFVGVIKLHILLILSILLQFCVIFLLNSVMDHKFCGD